MVSLRHLSSILGGLGIVLSLQKLEINNVSSNIILVAKLIPLILILSAIIIEIYLWKKYKIKGKPYWFKSPEK